ncbi:MAG: hypothetical protein U0704_02645 [Candidatus Eisenbacteria bacterium]
MTTSPTASARTRALAPLAFAGGLFALYANALATGFLNDDHLFLEQARERGLAALASGGGGLANYYRPLSREIWFGLLAPVADGRAWVFHAASLAVFLAAAALLFRLLRAHTGPAGAWIGTLWFTTLPLQRVNLLWISCNQELLALAGTLAAFAAWRARRVGWALLAYAAALASKDVAAPLPAALFLWSAWIERRPARETARALAPFALPLALLLAGELHLRSTSAAAATLRFEPSTALAAFAHLVQALTGLDAPGALPQALALARPSLVALAAFALLALAWPAGTARGKDGEPAAAPDRGPLLRFALAWVVLFTLPVIPVAHTWSSYYYTLAAAGAALAVGVLARDAARFAWLGSVLVLLLWHAVSVAAPSFAVAESAWNWTSHLTTHYFERGAALSTRMRTALLRIAPAPAPGTRFWFATLPEFAGFQMGNGAAIRALYRDPSLESHFYSQFAESTAASYPCEFLWWNGVDFERLYTNARDPFFQVGTDLLLLDRPDGAVWAFRRGLAAGESADDILPWLGWAQLWAGRRTEAEASWKLFGAKDDATMHVAWLRAARTALDEGDSTAARRALFDAMKAGIGRPEAHAVLGELLRARSPKFALLETLVATRLQPNDWLARRDLVAGLLDARLDERAAQELAVLMRIHPDAQGDPVLAQIEHTLRARRSGTRAGSSR